MKTLVYLLTIFIVSCNNNELITSLPDLKRGEIVSCGPQDGELFGSVSFTATVPFSLQKDFNIAVALLHSFEYDESEKVFAGIIDQSPECAMAYWGVAMSNFHPVWVSPTPAELQKGIKAIEIARSIKKKTKRESDYIEAIGKFFDHSDELDHFTRVRSFEKAMEKIYTDYPDDQEAAVFYTLALNAAADPADKTYSNQKKAVDILNNIFQLEPLHPGVAHYIIHNCDYPELAELALPAARKYASIAPSSAHAQHMPSHIFSTLGLWDESIQSDLVSVSAAKCYAEKANIKGHWDEELHGMDYLVYAYLQKGKDDAAKQQVDYLHTIREVYPVNFKTAYAFAAIPSRYLLEKKMWKEAAGLQVHPANFPWEKFPWQKAIFIYARLLGAVHTNNMNAAKTELENLRALYDTLSKQKEKLQEAKQVAIQVKISEALIAHGEGNTEKAIGFMTAAADAEDGMDKHPVTPGAVIPAREILAELLLETNKPVLALENFETDLKKHPNRFNALYGAGIAAQRLNNKEKAMQYFNKLLSITDSNCNRKEFQKIKALKPV